MSINELKDAVREMLIENGEYSNLKASLQEIVFTKLNKGSEEMGTKAYHEDVALMDALIVEYLTWRGCQHACSVFKTEGPVATGRLRKDLLRDLKVDNSSNEVPILLSILQQFKE